MIPIIVPLRSRRRERALALQKLQHAIPAVGLVSAGVQALRSGAEGFALVLASVEIVTSVLLIATIARSVRAARGHGRLGLDHAPGVDWIEIWAAAVLFAEALGRWHVRHHIARPIILTALLTLGLGLFHARLTALSERRRSLRVTDTGVYLGGRPFRALSATWKEIATITVQPTYAEIRTRSGRTRRLNLTDLEGADDVRGALREAQQRLRAVTESACGPREDSESPERMRQ